MLIFENEGELDARFITVFGMSAKETDSPIGRFGTGLKYAIAKILHNEGEITILSGEDTYIFTVEKTVVRDKEFNLVMVNGESANFTTDLGKDWEAWSAYREIYSNMLDEGGTVNHCEEELDVANKAGATRIVINDEDFDHIFFNQKDFVLDTVNRNPIYKTDFIEVYSRPSSSIFYNGIKVYDLGEKKFLYTYNIIGYETLTEDRTLKYPLLFRDTIRNLWLNCGILGLIVSVLKADKEEFLEGSFDYNYYDITPSLVFRTAVGEAKANKTLRNQTAAVLCERNIPLLMRVDIVKKEDLKPNGRQKLLAANKVIKAIFGKKNELEIKTVLSLGTGIEAEYDAKTSTLFINELSLYKQNYEPSTARGLYTRALKHYISHKPSALDDILKTINPKYLGKTKRKK